MLEHLYEGNGIEGPWRKQILIVQATANLSSRFTVSMISQVAVSFYSGAGDSSFLAKCEEVAIAAPDVK